MHGFRGNISFDDVTKRISTIPLSDDENLSLICTFEKRPDKPPTNVHPAPVIVDGAPEAPAGAAGAAGAHGAPGGRGV
eukprot:8665212-Pyramimonas_sp.AAC.1